MTFAARLCVCINWIWRAGILALGGAAAAIAVPWLAGQSARQLLDLTHGFAAGLWCLAFAVGMALADRVVWLLTGRELFAEMVGKP